MANHVQEESGFYDFFGGRKMGRRQEGRRDFASEVLGLFFSSRTERDEMSSPRVLCPEPSEQDSGCRQE